MLLTFLFWNVNKRPLQERIAKIVATYAVDVMMLAEWTESPSLILTALNVAGVNAFTFPENPGSKIHIFARRQKINLINEFDDLFTSRLTIRTIRAAGIRDVILAVVHLVSPVNWSIESQQAEATSMMQSVIETEDRLNYDRRLNHDRTILVGDFNMNPFHPGMVVAQGIHGMMTKTQAERGTRVIQGRPYKYFYNPMWSLLGDRTRGPAGTHYYPSAEPVAYFWNMYDQVLLRPALMTSLTQLEILTTDGQNSLVSSRGIPDKSRGSDHLPLLFQIKV